MSCHPAKFGGHKHSGSRDIIFVCHVNLLNKVIRALCDFIVRKPFKVSHHHTKFRGYRHCGKEYIMAVACHVISQDDVIKWSCDFMVSSPSR